MLAVIFHVHAENIEGLDHVITDLGRGFFLLDPPDQLLGHVPAAGIQFDQGIPTVLQHDLEAGGFPGRVRDQVIEDAGVTVDSLPPLRLHCLLDRDAHGTALGKGIQPLVEPAVLNLLAGSLQVGNMNPDGFGLSDTVQPTNPLLQQVRIGRQVEQHQMMGKLEVTTFAANLGADQRLGALLTVGEIGRGTVPLHQTQVFVERRTADTGPQLQVVLQRHGCFGVGTDHHHFRRAQA